MASKKTPEGTSSDDGSPNFAINQVKTFFHRGMLVSFKDIIYTVKNEQNKKENISLLKSVSGYLRSGELVALMGPSGSGKC